MPNRSARKNRNKESNRANARFRINEGTFA